jgi:hypothetical protein
MLMKNTLRHMHTRVNKERMLATTRAHNRKSTNSNARLARSIERPGLLDDVVRIDTSLAVAEVGHLHVSAEEHLPASTNYKMVNVVLITRAAAVSLHLDIAGLRGSLVMKRAGASRGSRERAQASKSPCRRDLISIRHGWRVETVGLRYSPAAEKSDPREEGK